MIQSNSVDIKFRIYTLACHELLDRIPKLRNITNTELRLDWVTCVERFDEVLNEFFNRSSTLNSEHAAKQFGDNLRAEAGYFSDLNSFAADIFHEVDDAIREKASSWDYLPVIENFHNQGIDLARRFYANSPFQVTQDLLGIKCHQIIDYGDRVIELHDENYCIINFNLAPMGFYTQKWDSEHKELLENVLVLRFTFSHRFIDYLAYPFLFLHEYTAHIYALDHGNELFNDGWMLHAADLFLNNTWREDVTNDNLSRDHINAFCYHLLPSLNPIPRRGYDIAKYLERLLPDEIHGKFMQYTHELAAYSPKNSENKYWPMQFINSLQYEMDKNRIRLIDKIHSSNSAHELMLSLSTV